jgi:glycosyltransferase involved in cell wall biosynthesis
LSTSDSQATAWFASQDNNSRISVLILIPTLQIGGAEMNLVRALPRIDRTQFEFVVCAYSKHGELATALTQAGIEVIGPILHQSHRQRALSLAREGTILEGAHLKGLPAALKLISISSQKLARRILKLAFTIYIYLRIVQKLARYIRASNIDIIHTLLPDAYLIGSLANILVRRRPLVMSRLSMNAYQNLKPFRGILERHVLHRFVHRAIGNSNAILTQLRTEGLPASKLHLIRNGIDVAAFEREMVSREQARHYLGLSSGSLIFSSVANLHGYKGHRDLLNALSLMSNQFSEEWTLLVVGRDIDGNLAELRRLSQQLGLSQHIFFLGQRMDVPIVLSAADVHVSASHEEGSPNNVIEAMCASLPVVATDVGGVPELVIHGGTGLLVPARKPGKMADALRVLATDRSMRRWMGAAGRARVESLASMDRRIAAFESIYLELARKADARTTTGRNHPRGPYSFD